MRLERGLHVRACSSTRGARPRRRGDRREGRTVIARVVCVPVDGEDHYYLSTLSRATFTFFSRSASAVIAGRLSFFRNWKGGSAHGPCSSAPQSNLFGRRRHGLDARLHPVGILRQALNDSRRKTSPWLRPRPETNPALLRPFPLASTPAAPFERIPRAPSPARPTWNPRLPSGLLWSVLPCSHRLSITLQLGRCCPALVSWFRAPATILRPHELP
jgi:hypothetical protein